MTKTCLGSLAPPLRSIGSAVQVFALYFNTCVKLVSKMNQRSRDVPAKQMNCPRKELGPNIPY